MTDSTYYMFSYEIKNCTENNIEMSKNVTYLEAIGEVDAYIILQWVAVAEKVQKIFPVGLFEISKASYDNAVRSCENKLRIIN